MSAEADGVFVGSGSFLIDRGRALDKLMRFQLPNPAAFALAWARCASAGGASHFTVTAHAGILTASFDGRPFAKEELEDPYRCLFEKRGEATDRNRQLAVGLLSVLRLKPASIRIASGRGSERRCLSVESLEKEVFESAEEGSDTVVTVSWPALTFGAAREAADLVRSGCVLSPMEITVDGVALPAWTDSAEPRRCFDGGGIRGWVAVPTEPEEESRIQLCSHGTVVENIAMKLPLVQVRAAINDDGFSLNASQSGVVRDARFDAALKRLAEPSSALIISTARAIAAAPVGAILQDAYFRRRWRETLEKGHMELGRGFDGVINAAQVLWTMASGGPGSEKEAALLRHAEAIRWLRRLCVRRLRPRTKASKDEVLNALWSAPLYVGADGEALSLDELSEQRKRLSYVPYCAEPAFGLSLPFRPLWSLSAEEADLPARLLDCPSRDVTSTVESLKRDPKGRGGAATFEQAGLPVPLIRVPIALGTVAGELGLSTILESSGRVHMLTQALPSGVIELEGSLRFEAVVADPARRWENDPLTANDSKLAEALTALVREAAPALYRRIAQENYPSSTTARAAAIRANLLDYLAHAVEKVPLDPADDWIRTVPLFEADDGRWVDHDLAAESIKRQPLYAARRGQEFAWQDGKNLILAPDFDGERIASLFPGCVRLPIRGRSGVFALVPGLSECDAAHPRTRCVAAVSAGPNTVHLGQPKTEDPEDFSWDALTVHSASGRGADLEGHPELLVELMRAVIRQAGPLLEAPDNPLRHLFLKALSMAPAPWPGASGKELWLALKGKPVFRSPGTNGRTLEDVYAALHIAGGRLTYAIAASESGAQPDLILGARELEALRRFQPLGSECLQPFGVPARARPVPVFEPEEPAPSNILSIFRGKPAVRSNERFFIERRYAGEGIDAWFGLSTRLPPPAPSHIEGGEFNPSQIPPIASILVDTRPDVDAPAATALTMSFLRQFYEEIAARWPVAKYGSPHFPVAQRYMLEALRRAALEPARFTGWNPVLRKIRGLKLFTALGGGLLSLDEVSELTAQDGILLFADPREPAPAISNGRPVPLLRNPKLVAEILSKKGPVKVKRFRPQPPPAAPEAAAERPVILVEPAGPLAADAEEAPAPPAAAEDLAPRPPVLEAALRLLAGLSGRKGLKLPKHELSDLRFGRGFDGTLLVERGCWTLNSDDALVKAIVHSNLSTEAQSAYLASVTYTASNRLKNVVTDLDDIRFQEALADTL